MKHAIFLSEKNSFFGLCPSLVLVTVPAVDEFQSVTGKGAYGTVEGEVIYAGSVPWMQSLVAVSQQLLKKVDELASNGHTVIVAANNERVLGGLSIADQIRPESKKMIQNFMKVILNIQSC